MKIAVITGASSGIGKDLTEALLTDSWKVYGVSRSKPDIKDENFVWLPCDLSKPSDIQDLQVDETEVDLVVSNAGVAFLEPATVVSEQSYEKMFSVNVLAPMLLIAKLKDKIKKATIVTISSVSDRIMDVDFALYCSSKAANTRYFETLALEMPDAKVISLLPDYIDTPMLRELQEGTDFDWSQTLKVEEMTHLIENLYDGKIEAPTGSNIIVINDQLLEDLKDREKLYGYNVSNNTLTRL
jgi:NAD(P)-dependent dehydrogenase (short-subunit alcohol dehydrogenase family)